MPTPEADQRSVSRRAQDEKIAAEIRKGPLDLPADARASPLEAHLDRLSRPMAVAGVVENGVVRPLDPSVKLVEHARVIIVAPEQI